MKLTPYVALLMSFATATPVAALTLLSDGSVYQVPVEGEIYLGSHATGGGAGNFEVQFNPVAGIAFDTIAQFSVTPFPVTTFTGLTMSWHDAVSGVQIAQTGLIIAQTPLFTTLLNSGQILRFEWTGSDPDASFQVLAAVAPATVPLPSGYLLLGTGLIGFGALRLRRSNT